MIDCEGLMTKDELIEKMNVGSIRLSVPNDSTVRLGIGEMTVSNFGSATFDWTLS
ncbi:hypothetical protein MYP_4632 [Sporocytophaga myxococcoides]|uniref:Uncharacterized protein n=2 Tax=Sporocytophaga myxococcoides TaxID=153721 RepID=A0A098LM43_9BACT|nr:hypothetical protein MYP_4632 [Sporocytophaga myxococcoides]